MAETEQWHVRERASEGVQPRHRWLRCQIGEIVESHNQQNGDRSEPVERRDSR